MTTTKFTAWALGVGATAFVLLLAGVASGALTDDPPAVSPYATGSPGISSTTTTAATTASEDAPETTAATVGPTIVIADFAFGESAPVSVGQEVTVLNNDGATHTWTSRDGIFDSQSLRSGDSFTHVFDAAGTFEFFCAIHPSMTGSITVTG